MNATAPISLDDRKKQDTLARLTSELAQAQSTGQRFAKLTHRYRDGDPNIFFECAVEAANAMNPPPHAIAPYYGEGSGRDSHSTAIACGVIISF